MGAQDAITNQSPTATADPGSAIPESRSGPRSSGRTAAGSSRASRAWLRVLPALIILAAILMFVFQNSKSTKVSFAVASGRIPLAVALLAAAALGALLVLAVGSIRIIQLRKVIRRLQPGDS